MENFLPKKYVPRTTPKRNTRSKSKSKSNKTKRGGRIRRRHNRKTLRSK